MLKKMLLFIAISSSFLPILGETDRQKVEKLEKQVKNLQKKIEDQSEEHKKLQDNLTTWNWYLTITLIPIVIYMAVKN